MRYVTPDTPSTRTLESQEKQARREKHETVAKMGTVTPTPTPKQSPEKAAAADTLAAQPAQPAQKRRRAIRTYGSKKRTLEDANDSRAKRPRLSLPAASTVSAVSTPTSTTTSAFAAPRPNTSDRTSDRLIDEVSRQLQKEAAEAERRLAEANNKENQTVTKEPPRPQTPRKTNSPRKALGIMRYFQPAAGPRPRTPPALQAAPKAVACSPAASISSMSSLSSCPSPTPSDMSVSFAYQEDQDGQEVDDSKAGDSHDDPLSPMVWREQARPKRRLTIRPEHVRGGGSEASEAGNEIDDEIDDEIESEDESEADTLAGTPIFKAFNGLSSSSRMRMQLGLAQAPPAELKAKTKTKTKTKARTVQTTLSLAIGASDSGSVRECKECNILYNPLHDKDAKFHARYHASVVGRGKKRV